MTGINCEIDIIECDKIDDILCQYPGTRKCQDTKPGEYFCLCELGYTGEFCEIDINECACEPCNMIQSICTDLIDGYRCTCNDGFYGSQCSLREDHCNYHDNKNNHTTVIGACGQHGKCHDRDPNLTSYPGFTCECDLGYTGEFCEIEINECASSPCGLGSCEDRVGLYICDSQQVISGFCPWVELVGQKIKNEVR